MTSLNPLIDPFYAIDKCHVTSAERENRADINLSFLATAKIFRREGIRLLIENNKFVFTQVAALDNFAKISESLRSTVKQVTFRIVGRYYGDNARSYNLSSSVRYHYRIDQMILPVLARPSGMICNGGIQAYCWNQVVDFLKKLILTIRHRPKLFPKLESLQLDLVNFTLHLRYVAQILAPVIRWHIGHIVDELIITGALDDVTGSSEENVLHTLLHDEGLYSSCGPRFISNSDGLELLPPHWLSHRVIRCREKSKKTDNSVCTANKKPLKAEVNYSSGTIWKWTTDYQLRPKSWIEFDRDSGLPIRKSKKLTVVSDENDTSSDDDMKISFSPPNHMMLLP
jgi:hypothetical protein